MSITGVRQDKYSTPNTPLSSPRSEFSTILESPFHNRLIYNNIMTMFKKNK